MNLLNLITLDKKKTFYIKYLYNNCKVYSSIKKELILYFIAKYKALSPLGASSFC